MTDWLDLMMRFLVEMNLLELRRGRPRPSEVGGVMMISSEVRRSPTERRTLGSVESSVSDLVLWSRMFSGHILYSGDDVINNI